ncbi:MAG: FAD-dependent oxidoreductase [Planctomycetes bacterium]|nr:FAD-dependent oxidoreductase [Planctomycetota bacterium]
MSTYTLPARELPLDESYDVVVVGGGPAGCTAAASAAREGAKTLLVEATNALGGMSSMGLVPFWCGLGDGEKFIARGMVDRVLKASKESMPHYRLATTFNPMATPAIDPELMKRFFDELVTGEGAEVLFQTQLCAVERSGQNGVDTIIVSNKAGLSAYRAKVYVDCSGDADLAAWAGADFQMGDENGEMQPATMCFMLSNIDEFAWATGVKIHFFDPNSPIHEAVVSDKYPLIQDKHTCSAQLGPGTYGFNTGHVRNVNGTDPGSLSKALMAGRQAAAQYLDLFSRNVPSMANCHLASTGGLLGVRETRRIIGDYVLAKEDFYARRSFPDEICRNAFGIDIHSSKTDKSKEVVRDANAAQNWEKKMADLHLKKGESFGVPYRCLTPKGLKNVLVAGRCASTDRIMNGSTRIMPCCMTMGEAAGMAAAHAARKFDSDVHAVDTDHLRARLREVGAYLP